MYKPIKTDLVYDDKFSFVAKDNQWKAYVQKEDITTKVWPEKWGFLVENGESKDPKPSSSEPSRRVKSLKPFPTTTSAFIGWKSTEKSCQLEIYGSHAKKRGSILKSFNWPNEAAS